MSLKRGVLGAVVAVLAVGSPATAATSSGFTAITQGPVRVAALAPTTVAFRIEAPPGATAASFTLDSDVPAGEAPARKPRARFQRAQSGASGSGTLSIRSARLDGPGTLERIAVAANDVMYFGCVRDGSLYPSSQPWFVELDGGASTTLLVDLAAPVGLVTRTPHLRLTAHAWQFRPVEIDDPFKSAIGAPTGSLDIAVQRTSGAGDAVSLRTRLVRAGRYRLSGAIRPSRAGQTVELVGTPGGRYSDGGPWRFDETATTLRTRHVLTRATTDAQGRWSARVRVNRGTVVAARTTTGLAGSTVAGASCPLYLAGKS